MSLAKVRYVGLFISAWLFLLCTVDDARGVELAWRLPGFENLRATSVGIDNHGRAGQWDLIVATDSPTQLWRVKWDGTKEHIVNLSTSAPLAESPGAWFRIDSIAVAGDGQIFVHGGKSGGADTLLVIDPVNKGVNKVDPGLVTTNGSQQNLALVRSTIFYTIAATRNGDILVGGWSRIPNVTPVLYSVWKLCKTADGWHLTKIAGEGDQKVTDQPQPGTTLTLNGVFRLVADRNGGVLINTVDCPLEAKPQRDGTYSVKLAERVDEHFRLLAIQEDGGLLYSAGWSLFRRKPGTKDFVLVSASQCVGPVDRPVPAAALDLHADSAVPVEVGLFVTSGHRDAIFFIGEPAADDGANGDSLCKRTAQALLEQVLNGIPATKKQLLRQFLTRQAASDNPEINRLVERLAGYPQRIRDSVVATLLAEDAAYSYSDSRTSHDHEPPTSNGNLHRLKFLLDQLSEEDRFLAQATISPTVFSSDRETIELIRKMRTLPLDLRERIASAELCPLWLKRLRQIH